MAVLKRYIHKEGGFKVAIVDTTQIGRDVFSGIRPSPIALQLLTQAMTGALLLSADLKRDGTLLYRFKGDGPGGHLTVEANTMGHVRGCMGDNFLDFDLQEGVDLFQIAMGSGNLSAKRKMEPDANIYSSVVEMVPGGIALNYANYLLQSEQVASAVQIGVALNPECGVQGAGGILIQAMPGANENLLFILEQRLQEMKPLGNLFSEPDGHEQALAWLMDDMDVKPLKETGVKYFCNCTQQRMLQVLSTLPISDLEDMRKDNEALSINCSFCSKSYQVPPQELDVLIDMKTNPA